MSAGSENYSGMAIIRNEASIASSCNAEIRNAGSEAIPSAVLIRNIGSKDLPCDSMVRNADFIDYSATSEIRNSGSSALSCSSLIRNAGFKTLSYSSVIRNADSKDLSSSVVIRNIGSKGFSASTIIQNEGSKNLSCSAFVYFVDSKDLFSAAVIRNIGSENLSAEVGIAQWKDLSCESYVEPTLANLSCSAIIRQSSTKDLSCFMRISQGTFSKNLFCWARIIRPRSEDWSRYAEIEFSCWGTGSQGVYYFRIWNDESYREGKIIDNFVGHRVLTYILRDLPGSILFDWQEITDFEYEWDSSGTFRIDEIWLLGSAANLSCSMSTNNRYIQYSASAIIRHSASQNLPMNCLIFQHDSRNLSCSFVITSKDLSCSVRISHPASQDLSCNAFILPSIDLIASAIIRHSASKDLSISSRISKGSSSKDLSAVCEIRHSSSKNLSCEIFLPNRGSANGPLMIASIRNIGAANVSCRANIHPFDGFAEGPSIWTVIQNRGYDEQGVSITIIKDGSKDLSGSALIRGAAAPELSVSVTIRQRGAYVDIEDEISAKVEERVLE